MKGEKSWTVDRNNYGDLDVDSFLFPLVFSFPSTFFQLDSNGVKLIAKKRLDRPRRGFKAELELFLCVEVTG